MCGSPQKVLVDNRGNFANDDFIKMTEAIGINVLNTAAESPWSKSCLKNSSAPTDLHFSGPLMSKTAYKLLLDFPYVKWF